MTEGAKTARPRVVLRELYEKAGTLVLEDGREVDVQPLTGGDYQMIEARGGLASLDVAEIVAIVSRCLPSLSADDVAALRLPHYGACLVIAGAPIERVAEAHAQSRAPSDPNADRPTSAATDAPPA